MKKYVYLVIVLALSGCWPCDTIIIENGPLPESVLKFVPYQDGGVYKFKHSNGLIINFETTRETHEEWSGCAECCTYQYHYEVNSVKLIPDYPIFNFYFEISNMDTTNFDCSASIGKFGFCIPTSEKQSGYNEKASSLIIGSIKYYNVFKLKSNYDSYYNNDLIFVDSLFYNYDFGILKILMSNGEYYEVIQ